MRKYKRFRVKLRNFLNELPEYLIDVVYDRRKDGFARIIAYPLTFFSWLFSGIVRLRYLLYEKRILQNNPLGCLVVVVGNLTVGGTGKTPVVEKFARVLNENGRKVAILSRGYKSKSEPFYKKWLRLITHSDEIPPKIVSDGKSVLLDSEVAGDEPFMLAKNLPGVVVLVDPNRVKAGKFAIRKFGVDTLILDDGMQYLPLKGRLNLLLVDKNNPFGNHHLLPRGILREPVKHLRRASYIFLTKSDGNRTPELESFIRTYNPCAEIIECAHKPRYLQEVNGTKILPLDALQGKKVAAFSGIAVPESFEKFLQDFGAEIVYKKRFFDHHRFSDLELEFVFENSERAGAEFIVTTEKDAVRIEPQIRANRPLYYLRLEIEIISGENDFKAAVERICFPSWDPQAFTGQKRDAVNEN